MRKVLLGRSGLEVSAVGFGGIPIQRISEAEAVNVIRRAIDLGVTFIDTADGYTDSQKKIGKAIRDLTEKPVIATKSGAGKKEEVLRHIDKSLSEMGLEQIDLFQFHGVSSSEKWEQITGPDGAMDGVLAARDAGKVAHIGVTSHKLDLAVQLVEEPVFETIQFPFNLVTSEPAGELIPKARRLNLGFIVMKPLCGGLYDNARLAFKFLNSYPDLVPIPGIERTGEIEEIVSLVESGATLQGEEKAEADSIARRLGKKFCRRCQYCEPCPNGVPCSTAMVMPSMLRRLNPNAMRERLPAFLEKLGDCTECGECESKCPYELPIIRTIKDTSESVRAFLAGA